MRDKGKQEVEKPLDVIAALRRLRPDSVLVDSAGKAWTAEDLEYTLLDEIRNKRWRSSPVKLVADGIYRVDENGQPAERLYLLSEAVTSN